MRSTASPFRALHHAGPVLVLPNAWDAGTARLIESVGARAIATSSAALAWAHGAADGERLPPATLVAAAQEMARAIRVPLSVDLEAGYHAEPEGIADLVAALLDVGVVGLNLEDGSGAPELLARKLSVARRVAAQRGVDLFLNARTDVYLRTLVPAARAVEEVAARARRYQEAGADGLFVPGLARRSEVEAVVRATALPLNLMALPQLPAAAELGAWGVRRLSAGSALAQATLALVRRASRELLEQGTGSALFADALPYGDLNALFLRAPAADAPDRAG